MILSPVTVAIQKSRRADRLVVHIDKLKLYVGDAPASWIDNVEDTLEGDCSRRSPTKAAAVFPGSPVHPASEVFETELGVGVNVCLPDGDLRSVMRPGTSPAGTRQSALTTRPFTRPARVHRPPAHLRDFECRRIINVYSVPQDIKQMDGLDAPLPVRPKDPAGYECYKVLPFAAESHYSGATPT